MFRKKKWVALIKDNRWAIAKISGSQKNLRIYKLFEYMSEKEVPVKQNLLQLEQSEAISNTLEQGKTLQQKLKQERVPLKKLKVTMSCPGVITRIITLPLLTTKELDKLLTEQVDQYFTLNIEDYLIDYRILEHIEEEGQKRLRILLAALPKEQWEKFQREWVEIGFTPKVVDLAADSLARLYSKVGGSSSANPQSSSIPDLAILDLGRDRVEFVLLEHGVFFLYSDLEVDLKGLDKYTASFRDIQSEDPLEILTLSDIEKTLTPVLNTLANFLSFFSSRHYGKSIDCIYLTGYYANTPQLSQIFKTTMGLETLVGFPGDWRPRYKAKMKGLNENWSKYGSLYGLALRED